MAGGIELHHPLEEIFERLSVKFVTVSQVTPGLNAVYRCLQLWTGPVTIESLDLTRDWAAERVSAGTICPLNRVADVVGLVLGLLAPMGRSFPAQVTRREQALG